MKNVLKCNCFIGISVLMIIICGCAGTSSVNTYTVKGTLNDISSGKVKLVKHNQKDRTTKVIDSSDFTGGSFTLQGAVESPEMMTLIVEPGNWSVPVFVENNVISLQADTANAEYFDWTAYGGDKGARIKIYTITGSKNQDDLMKYENDPALKYYEPIFEKLQKAYNEAGDNKDEANKIKGEMDSVRTMLTAKQKNWIDSFITVNPSSAAGAYMLNNYYMYNQAMPLEEMENLLVKFTGPAKSTVYFNTLSEALTKRKALQPGNVAPDFTLLKTDSSSFTLSSLRGKYVMLDFWASWCVPCRKAIPHWKEVYQKYQPQGFEILAITNDIKWDEWFKALEKEQMAWLQVADEFPVKNMPSRVGDLYMIPYLPSYVLLDQEGKIILHNATKEQIDEKLKEIFGS